MSESPAQGNFISEWFGHRLFPGVITGPSSTEDQQHETCPFLTAVKGHRQECIKAESSKGVCTINSSSNGPRQDWLACPYRAFDQSLMRRIVGRMYDFPPKAEIHTFPAPILAEEENQALALDLVGRGEAVLVYFDQKMGGEIQVSPTDASPQIAFDTTFVELVPAGESVGLGRFGVVEIQTMDFHGSYRRAVKNLKDALRLHGEDFPKLVDANQRWMADGIEGPNIANVFKRTFYQLMLKFGMASTPGCAGVALVIPAAVWDSWQRFLGAPRLVGGEDGVLRLPVPGRRNKQKLVSWIYVIDLDGAAPVSPSPVEIRKIIRTSSEALAHHALEEAPKSAITELSDSLYPTLARRLRQFWPLPIEAAAAAEGGVDIVEEDRPIEEAELED